MQELRAYTARRGASPSQCDAVVAACRGAGWVDDRLCAALWATHWADRGFAASVIREKLAAKGLRADDAPGVLGSGPAVADESSRARAFLHAHLPPHPTPLALRRLARRLAGRGFDPETIDAVMRPHLARSERTNDES